MRIHHIGLETILPGLAQWEGLEPQSRLTWILTKANRNLGQADRSDDALSLRGAGLLETTPTGLLRVAEGMRPLHTLLRAAQRCEVLAKDARLDRALKQYIQETYRESERVALLDDPRADPRNSWMLLVKKVSSRAWVEGFLGTRPGAWEQGKLGHADGEDRGWERLLTPAVHADLVHLVGEMARTGSPAPFSSLFEDLPKQRIRVRALALQAAFRYLILFPRLERESVQFEVGLAPVVATGLTRSAPPAPTPAAEDVAPAPAFLIADMIGVLLDAASGEARVKANSAELYQKTSERMCSALSPLPPPVDALERVEDNPRIDRALWSLQALELVIVERMANNRRLLVPTDAGRAWLGSTRVERLRMVVDPLRGPVDIDEEFVPEMGWHSHESARRIAPLVSQHDMPLYAVEGTELVAEIRAALATLPTEGAVAFKDWIHHQAYAANPLTGTGPGGHQFKSSGYAWAQTSVEQREDAWTDILFSAVAHGLMPIGGVALGGEKDAPLIALTPVGRYVIREADELELPPEAARSGRILVQPNFDVVFLGPDPEHEALLAPFAERVGHGVGTLFHLTREAAMRAASAGLAHEEALERLRSANRDRLPDNVERSLRDWFARVRLVEAEHALVLRCPDEETAARIVAVGGAKVVRLGPLVVEFEDTDQLRRLRKKLEKEGIVVGRLAAADVPSRPSRPRRRRRRW